MLDDLFVSGGPPRAAIRRAVAEATRSPCQKSKRGAAAWNTSGTVVAAGNNFPPLPIQCDGSGACKRLCAKRCIHAEAHVLLARPPSALPFDMLHIKMADGEPVPSGPPSCWQCSRLIAELVRFMWLFHEDGWRRYTGEEFHRLTLEHCGLLNEEAPDVG